MDSQKLEIGQIYRYGRPYDPKDKIRDGFPNYFNKTYNIEDTKSAMPLLEKGINPIAEVKISKNEKRRPAILISSSPHKIGSNDTPWHDFFNSDFGHIRYYGDNKSPDTDAQNAPGNKTLLEQYKKHSSLDPKERESSVPIIFFQRVPVNGKIKGYIKFQGYGIIQSVQLVTQYDRKNDRTFTNYEFDFAVFNLIKENEKFNWKWINKRRSKTTTMNTLTCAPEAWKQWIKNGNKSLFSYLRKVSKLTISSSSEQKPKDKNILSTLNKIYDFYNTPSRKKRFEAFAAKITESIMTGSSKNYKNGWVTQGSSDGGADFIGRLDIGEGFSTVKIIVLGQAKCEKIDTPTGGNHIARTVARLKRGWIGVYVTTSYFSESVQREIYEDQYPIMLINGLQIAEESLRIVSEKGYKSIDNFLNDIDMKYESLIKQRKAEEILLD